MTSVTKTPTSRTWRRRACVAAAALAGALAHESPAHALVGPVLLAWVPVPTSGCATDIAVGPNNVPWVLGCPASGPWPVGLREVYYLDGWLNAPAVLPGSCSGLLCEPEWIDDGFAGLTLAVDLSGQPWATDANGVINGDSQSIPWELNHGCTVGSCPAGPPMPGGAGSWGPMGSGAVGAFVASPLTYYADPAQHGELFDVNVTSPFDGYGYFGGQTFWGVGCGSECTAMAPYQGEFDGSLWTQSTQKGFYSGDSSSGWSEMGGAATAFALFTEQPGVFSPAVIQTPWVLNAEGQVYFWNTQSWQNQPTPERVRSITDNYILGVSGTLYKWNGTASGQGNTTWTNVGVANVLQPSIKQIAFANGINTDVVKAGGWGGQMFISTVWGIDYSGIIYNLQETQTVTPP